MKRVLCLVKAYNNHQTRFLKGWSYNKTYFVDEFSTYVFLKHWRCTMFISPFKPFSLSLSLSPSSSLICILFVSGAKWTFLSMNSIQCKILNHLALTELLLLVSLTSNIYICLKGYNKNLVSVHFCFNSASQPLPWGPKVLLPNSNLRLKVGLFF